MKSLVKTIMNFKVNLPAWLVVLLFLGGGSATILSKYAPGYFPPEAAVQGPEPMPTPGISVKDAVQDEQIKVLQKGQDSMIEKLDKILERLPTRSDKP